MNGQVRSPALVGLQTDRQVETHLSVLFFAGEYVYKVKKPVKQDAVDFSTLALREKACAREVRLGQRFAGSVHLDVLPLYDEQGEWTLQANGEPIEYCVRMRRLPEEQMLDARQGRLAPEELQWLASSLNDFYREAKTSEKISRAGLTNAIEPIVRSNLKSLREVRPQWPVLDLLESALLEFLALRETDFADRVSQGKIKDGHGDLRLEHIAVRNPPVFLDCVEYQDRLRHVDVLDDVAGLILELDRVGQSDTGRTLWTELARKLGEDVEQPLLNFYLAYRALGRARAEAAQQPPESNSELVQSYLEAAAGYCRRFHHLRLVITFGLLGTGKSTLSQALANTIGIKRLSTEGVRRELYSNGNGVAPRRNPYSPEEQERVYQRLFDLARQSLLQGTSVVLDASFTTNDQRARALRLAEEVGAEPLFLECRLSKSDAIARLDQRFKKDRTNSAVRPEYYEEHLQLFEPSDQLPPDRVLPLTTTVSVPELVDAVVEAFAERDKDS